MLEMALNVMLAAFAFSMLLFVHELGHFVAAKAIGVRVEAFSLGFWKKLVGFTWRGTQYKICLIPLGGYVKMAGEMTGQGTGDPGEFCTKSPGRRALVLVAGSFMNMMLAVVGFVLAFAIGVPFAVAEVGSLESGQPAWEEGLRVGDKIVQLDGKDGPDFEDLSAAVILGGARPVSVKVKRDGGELDFVVTPRYDKEVGMTRIGIAPPRRPIVTKLFEVEGADGRRPAKEAGVELDDKVLQINGVKVLTAADIEAQIGKATDQTFELVLERDGHRRYPTIRAEPRYMVGISGVGTTVKRLQGDGVALHLGLEAGDRIVRVNDTPVESVVAVEDAIEEGYGPVTLAVERDGDLVPIPADVPDRGALAELLFSIEFESSNVLAWVREGGPAWRASMRPGDRIVEVGGREVESWREVLVAGGESGRETRTIRWRRDGAESSEEVTPEPDDENPQWILGFGFHRSRSIIRQHGLWTSVKTGVSKTWNSAGQVFLSIKGLIRGQISTRHTGSVILIAQSTYYAAQEGLGKLLYLTAAFSCMLGLLNMLPIPILDGGHMMFLAIEKLRGRPVSQKVMAISSYVGLSLLVALMLYATRNDILRHW